MPTPFFSMLTAFRRKKHTQFEPLIISTNVQALSGNWCVFQEEAADLVGCVFRVLRPPFYRLGEITDHMIEDIFLRCQPDSSLNWRSEQVCKITLEITHEDISPITGKDPGQVVHVLLQMIQNVSYPISCPMILRKVMGLRWSFCFRGNKLFKKSWFRDITIKISFARQYYAGKNLIWWERWKENYIRTY